MISPKGCPNIGRQSVVYRQAARLWHLTNEPSTDRLQISAVIRFIQYNMPTELCKTLVHICISVDNQSSDHRPMVARLPIYCPTVVRLLVDRRPMQIRSVPWVISFAYFLCESASSLNLTDRVQRGKSADQPDRPDHNFFLCKLGITHKCENFRLSVAITDFKVLFSLEL